jgi:hypothetical protein
MRVDRRLVSPFILVLCLCPLRVQGQWSAAVQVGADRFWGGSDDNTQEHRGFRPYRPTTFGAGIQRQGAKFGIGLRVGYSEAGLALEGSGAAVSAEGVFRIFSLMPAITYRLATLGTRNALFVEAGPLLERWDIIDEGARTRIGGQAGLDLVVPLGGKIDATVSAGLALISSPFQAGELLPEYELRSLWRRRFAGGLQYRL